MRAKLSNAIPTLPSTPYEIVKLQFIYRGLCFAATADAMAAAEPRRKRGNRHGDQKLGVNSVEFLVTADLSSSVRTQSLAYARACASDTTKAIHALCLTHLDQKVTSAQALRSPPCRAPPWAEKSDRATGHSPDLHDRLRSRQRRQGRCRPEASNWPMFVPAGETLDRRARSSCLDRKLLSRWDWAVSGSAHVLNKGYEARIQERYFRPRLGGTPIWLGTPMLLALLLVGCASVPTNYAKQHTTTIRETSNTELGRQVQRLTALHPNRSGF
jgi:hypothetical protein